MTSEPTLDIESLLLPVSPDAPGGVPMPEALRGELERLRKAAPAAADGTASGKRPAPDFRAIIADATDALANKSKDVALVTRIVEANTVVHGTAGLRDGLKLLARVVAACWDWLHPLPKHAEDASRGNRLKWLNAVDSGAEFPHTVQSLPLVVCGTDQFTFFDTLDPARVADLDAAVGQCNAARLRATHQELTEASAALAELSKELKAKLGADNAPDFTGPEAGNLGTALRNCLAFVASVAARRGVSLTGDAPASADAPAESATGGAAAPAPTRAPDGESREALYQQIERIAGILKRVEPHSPVPFLLERCVKLGKLPFPELMQALIRDGGALTELDRLLGKEQS